MKKKNDLTISPNQIYIDWDFNTYELAIFIKPRQYLMQDIAKPGEVTDAEREARKDFQRYVEAIRKFLNNEDMK